MTDLTPEAIELAIRQEIHSFMTEGDIHRLAKRIFRLISDDSGKTSDDYRMIRSEHE